MFLIKAVLVSLPVLSLAVQDWHLKKNLPKIYIQVKLHFTTGFLQLVGILVFFISYMYTAWLCCYLDVYRLFYKRKALQVQVQYISIYNSSKVAGRVRQSLSDRLVLLYVQSSSGGRDLSLILKQSSNESLLIH